MQVIVTRARDDATRTAAKLASLGHTAILSPVLEMFATDARWPAGVIDAIVATSAQAFELLKSEAELPLPETRRLLPLFLVGERTRAAAGKRGFEGPTVLAPDANELTESILGQPGRLPRILYLAGRDRKSDLEQRLAEAGLNIETVEVYQARATEELSPAALACLQSGTKAGVLHYSRRSAAIFLRLAASAGVDPAPLLHAAISPDAAAPLRERNLPHIAVAAEPNEASMLCIISEKWPPVFGQK
jgi:uroporphyrinogen-III synthase